MKRARSEDTAERDPRIAIPTVRTSFVGRERELEEVARLLAASRLVTLSGSAGCGKTRLALRVGADMSHHFPDGVHWIELARLAEARLVIQSVARAVNVVEQSDRPLLDGLVDALRDEQMLLVLDNCEHVLSACAHLAETLLAATDVSVLASSREPLSVEGEMLYPVSPLSLPPQTATAADTQRSDAVRLFVERACAILPDFALTPDNAGAVISICRRLDGIPLAIELASARVKILTVAQIAARLDNRFELLPPAPHLTHSHHHTLRAAIDWSYDLLSAPEQLMLRRLSVFAAGCSLTTTEAVCAGDGLEREQVLDIVSSLVNKSLIVAATLQRGEARYSLLETIRQYAQEKLLASGEALLIHDRYLDCFLRLTEETATKLSGTDQRLWLDWLEEEYDNIRAALSWSLERGRIEAGLRLAVAIYQFWTIRDYAHEGLSWLERLLARVDEAISPVIRANALANASFLAGFRGNTSAQLRYGREAAVLAEAAGDEGKSALAWALAGQGYAARAAGDYQTEFTLAMRVIEVYRELGDRYRLGVGLSTGSFAAMSAGEFGAARAMLDEGLILLRELGIPYRIAMALNFSGDLARCEQRYGEARIAYEESVALLRELDAPRDLASGLHNLGHTVLHLGDVARAQALFHESLALHQAQHNTPGVVECLIGFAALAVARSMPSAGVRLLAASVAIGGERVATAWPATRAEYKRSLSLARAGLTEAEIQTAEEVGRALSLEQAVTYALNLPLEAPADHGTRNEREVLTAREREVAALIAQGKSNGEIADEFFVSKRTVEKHVANILSRLGFTQRAQIVRWAMETKLVTSTE